MVRGTVLLFVILGHVPLVLLVCLVGLLYLTWVDLRNEDLEPIVQLWWYLLVFLTNLLGYVGAADLARAQAPARRRASSSLTSFTASSSASRSSASSSSPVTRSIRASRWRSVFGWM